MELERGDSDSQVVTAVPLGRDEARGADWITAHDKVPQNSATQSSTRNNAGVSVPMICCYAVRVFHVERSRDNSSPHFTVPRRTFRTGRCAHQTSIFTAT